MSVTHFSGPVTIAGALTVGGALALTGALTGTGGIKAGASGTLITQIVVYTKTFDPASVAANTVSAQTMTIAGLTTDDIVLVNPGIATIGHSGSRVSAADTLQVILTNPTAASIDGASSDWLVVAFRS